MCVGERRGGDVSAKGRGVRETPRDRERQRETQKERYRERGCEIYSVGWMGVGNM